MREFTRFPREKNNLFSLSAKGSFPYSLRRNSDSENEDDADADGDDVLDILDNFFGDRVYHNFMIGNKIFLLDEINHKNTSKLIATMSLTIDEMGNVADNVVQHAQKNGGKVEFTNLPLIDMYINSPGGYIDAYQTISGFLTMAKMRNIMIRTYVFGMAASAASLLAIQGTQGLRVMSSDAQNMVHWGSYFQSLSKSSEIDKSADLAKRFETTTNLTYMRNTKITQKKLNELMKDEMGYLDAAQCKKLGFCDVILSPADVMAEVKRGRAR